MTRTYYQQRYCNECIAVHWMEITQAGKEICHGEQFSPQPDQDHYTRRLGRGIELVGKSIPLPLDWQMALDSQERETIDASQEW